MRKLVDSRITQDIEKQIHALARIILKEVPGVKKIYLFGSYAYGKPHEDSDLDLFVITDKHVDNYLQFMPAICLKFYKYEKDFDIIINGEQHFNDRKDTFMPHKFILPQGKLVYERKN